MNEMKREIGGLQFCRLQLQLGEQDKPLAQADKKSLVVIEPDVGTHKSLALLIRESGMNLTREHLEIRLNYDCAGKASEISLANCNAWIYRGPTDPWRRDYELSEFITALGNNSLFVIEDMNSQGRRDELQRVPDRL